MSSLNNEEGDLAFSQVNKLNC